VSFVQPVDKTLFDNSIDDRIIKKVVDRSLAFVLPIQNRLNDRRIHFCLTIKILDRVLIGFVQRLAAAEEVLAQNLVSEFFSGSQRRDSLDLHFEHRFHGARRILGKLALHRDEIHRERNP
jgi:hypothetical protein